jgi:hypothetical protein
MADSIIVNGNQYNWGSLIAKIAGEPYSGFTAITYADKRERVKGYGMGRHQAPRGRSGGKYTIENPKITGPVDSMIALRAALAARSRDKVSYGNVAFEWVLQYVENDMIPMHVVLERCVVVGFSANHSEGPDNLLEECELDCMLIRRNGLVLFDQTKGSP